MFQCYMTWDLGEGDEDGSSFDLYHDIDEEKEDTDNDMADELSAPTAWGATHHEDVGGTGVESDSEHDGDDGFSSGISEAGTDANSDQEHDGDDDSEALLDPDSEQQIVSSGARPALGKIKAYHLSPEWKELQRLSQRDGIDYTVIPPVVGAGVARHPSNTFWSGRYPGEPWITCKWSESRTELTSLVRVIRHVVKLHLKTAPVNSAFWKAQLESLATLT